MEKSPWQGPDQASTIQLHSNSMLWNANLPLKDLAMCSFNSMALAMEPFKVTNQVHLWSMRYHKVLPDIERLKELDVDCSVTLCHNKRCCKPEAFDMGVRKEQQASQCLPSESWRHIRVSLHSWGSRMHTYIHTANLKRMVSLYFRDTDPEQINLMCFASTV
jgi:hypothetical protein